MRVLREEKVFTVELRADDLYLFSEALDKGIEYEEDEAENSEEEFIRHFHINKKEKMADLKERIDDLI